MRVQREIFTCDRCSAELEQPITFKVHVGWCEGAVTQEHDIKYIDLCSSCAGIALQRICNLAKNFDEAEAFVEAARDKSPFTRNELP